MWVGSCLLECLFAGEEAGFGVLEGWCRVVGGGVGSGLIWVDCGAVRAK
jgi:hypothetical protein